jgi:hypothetical protein
MCDLVLRQIHPAASIVVRQQVAVTDIVEASE